MLDCSADAESYNLEKESKCIAWHASISENWINQLFDFFFFFLVSSVAQFMKKNEGK